MQSGLELEAELNSAAALWRLLKEMAATVGQYPTLKRW